MRSLAAVSFIALAVVVLVAGAAAASAGFADPPDSAVPAGTHPSPAQIGRFAVLVYNLNRGAKLKYVGVSNSVRHPHQQGGVRYGMVVTAADDSGATAQYQVLVWGIPRTYQWMLLEFNKIN